jgi:acetyl-CoA carboxylase biotin carboxyl carrier protein
MIDLEFVESLIRALNESSLDSLELERGGTRIRLSKSPPLYAPLPSVGAPSGSSGSHVSGNSKDAVFGNPSPGSETLTPEVAAESEAPSGPLIEVTSPMVGTFYRAPSPDAPPYVEVGARVGKGSVLCIIEAMKLMNELESEVGGTIAKILVENAQPVEYGQVLFLIDPS